MELRTNLNSHNTKQRIAPDGDEQPIGASMYLGSGSALALGAETHRMTACLLESVQGQYRLASWFEAPTVPTRTIGDQMSEILAEFGTRLGRILWDAEKAMPFIQSTNPIQYPPLEHVSIAASPLPRLRVWLVGIAAYHSLNALYEAVEASQAAIVGAQMLEAHPDHKEVSKEITDSRAEAIIFAGGYETPNATPQPALIQLAQRVSNILREIPDELRPKLLYAGNTYAFPLVAKILSNAGVRDVLQVDNVSPSPGRTNIQPLSHAIDDLYREKCRKKGELEKLEEWSTAEGELLTVESSFVRTVQLWMELNDLPELYGIYTGRNRWLHVWADAEANRVLARFAPPNAPATIDFWRPAVRIVSGGWIDDELPPDSVQWWDERGLAPIIAAAALTSPRVAIDALREDILIDRG